MMRLAARWLVLLLVAGCGQRVEPLVVGATTSVDDTGLFDALLPVFSRAHPNYEVKLLAVGSGEALALGRRSDADVLLVHSPAAEQEFMDQGHGTSRRPVMTNDFVVLGDSADPAKIRGEPDVVRAFARIGEAHARFVSRGDQSGTHVKERELWRATGRDTAALHTLDARGWYVEVGQGMADALRVANETHAYVLSDRGTYLALSNAIRLQVLVEGDPRLLNHYSVIVVNRARNKAGGQAFADWIVGKEAQQLIGSFGRERFGRSLFNPASSGN
jgi:tungstate transport system substrate-binding protein